MAPRTIRQRISLDGAEEIKSALQQIGDAGRAAFTAIRSELQKAGDAGAPLLKRLDQLQDGIKEFRAASDRLTQSTRRFKLAMSEVAAAAGTFTSRVGLLAAGATAATGAIFGVSKAAADSVIDMKRLADGLGLPIKELSRLQYAADQFGAGDAIGPALLQFQTQVAEAAEAARAGARTIGDATRAAGVNVVRGTDGMKNGFADVGVTVTRAGQQVKEATAGTTNLFEKLGIAVVDAQGNTRNLVDVFKEFSDAYRRLPDNADKIALGVEALGEDDLLKLGSLLAAGSAELSRLGDEGERVGAVFGDAEAAISQQFTQALARMNSSIKGVRDQIGLVAAPAFTDLFDGVGQLITENRDKLKQFAEDTSQALLSVVRDIGRLLRGEDGAVENTWLISLRDGFIEVKDAAIFAFDLIRGAINTVAAVIDNTIGAVLRLFGVEVTGKGLLLAAILLKVTGGFRLLWAALKLGKSSIGVVTSLFGVLRKGLPVLRDASFLAGTALRGAFKGLGESITNVFRSNPAKSIEGIGTAAKKAGGAAKGGFGAIGRAAATAGTAVAGLVSAPVVVGAAFATGAALTVVYWDDIKLAVAEGWEKTKRVLAEAQEGIAAFGRDAWALLASSARRSFDGIVTVVTDGWAGAKRATETAAAAIDTAAGDVWAAITERGRAALTAAETVARDTWAGVGAVTASAKAGLGVVASDTWSAIEDAARGLADRVRPVWDEIRDTARNALATVARTVLEAWTSATTTVEDSARAIQDAITRATEIAGDVAGAENLAASLVAPFIDARDQIQRIVDGFGALAENGFRGVLQAVDNIADDIARRIDRIISDLRRAAEEARRLARAASDGGDGGSSSGGLRTVVQEFARGGAVWGPGTKTSDSILARLSRGEFVIRADAVQRIGLPFLHALNSFKGSFAALPKFNAGGLVDGLTASMAAMTPAPAFRSLDVATAPAGRPLILDFGGGNRINAGTVGQDVVAELMRAAKGSAASQISRKPGWAGS